MKVMLLSNQARSMYVFWRVLIECLRKEGHIVECCVPAGDAVSEADLASLGCNVVHYALERKGLNPFADLRTFAGLKKIFAARRPDLVFATTIKPVIYGGLAAAAVGVPAFYATITGLGYAFESDTLFKKAVGRIAESLYRKGLAKASGVFFQNREDANVFAQKKLLDPDTPVFFARGTGVDTARFASCPFPDAPIVFLLVGRLLEAKGIGEYAEAARMLKRDFPSARFQLLGGLEKGPGSIDPECLAVWQEEGLEYLGETRDVRPYLAAAHVAVLPSWREGTPTALMEAMSMGRPLVATDVPGCREVIRDGINGFLCEARNPASLATAMRRFLLDQNLAYEMGAASRSIACEKFDARVVAERIIADMEPGLSRSGAET